MLVRQEADQEATFRIEQNGLQRASRGRLGKTDYSPGCGRCFSSYLARRAAPNAKASILWFDKTIAEVEIAEPTAGQFFEIGMPLVTVFDRGGTFYEVEQAEALKSYADRCIQVENSGWAFLAALPLADGLAIRRTLIDFFTAAAPKGSS